MIYYLHQSRLKLTVPQTLSVRDCAGTLQRLRDSWRLHSGSLRMPAVQTQWTDSSALLWRCSPEFLRIHALYKPSNCTASGRPNLKRPQA